jgi:preprotein translocase subunit SecE
MCTTKERAVSDELDNADAATAGTVTPRRPTGKRARQRALVTPAGDAVAAAVVGDDGGGARHGPPPAGAGVAAAVVVDDEGGGDASIATAKTPKKSSGKSGSRNPITIVITYLRQVVAELRKVIWPNRKQMVTYTLVVLVFLAFMVALIGVVDLGLAKLVLRVLG